MKEWDMINKDTKGRTPPNMKNYIYAVILTAIGVTILPSQTAPQTKQLIEKPVVVQPVAAIAAAPVAIAEPVPAPIGDCTIAYRYDWPQQTAYAICMAESGGNAQALNGRDNHGSCSGSYSLWQVGCFWYPFYGYEISYDPQVNAQIAYNIWKRQGGFTAWTTYTSGKYLTYL